MSLSAKFDFNTTIRPGLLVAVKTSIKGNVTYKKTDLADEILPDGEQRATWETERKVKDAAEQEAASKCRSKARSLIAGICSVTDFGYLCPISAKPELEKAVAEARNLCETFNSTSVHTKIRFGAITGTVAQDDYQAIRAIRREVSELLTDMEQGLKALDVKTVREAAVRATQLGQMLTPEAQVRLELTIKAVRENANKIVKAGETGAKEIDRRALQSLTEARTAFLDIDQPEGSIASPMVEGRGVDFAPEKSEVSAAPVGAARSIEV